MPALDQHKVPPSPSPALSHIDRERVLGIPMEAHSRGDSQKLAAQDPDLLAPFLREDEIVRLRQHEFDQLERVSPVRGRDLAVTLEKVAGHLEIGIAQFDCTAAEGSEEDMVEGKIPDGDGDNDANRRQLDARHGLAIPEPLPGVADRGLMDETVYPVAVLEIVVDKVLDGVMVRELGDQIWIVVTHVEDG